MRDKTDSCAADFLRTLQSAPNQSKWSNGIKSKKEMAIFDLGSKCPFINYLCVKLNFISYHTTTSTTTTMTNINNNS